MTLKELIILAISSVEDPRESGLFISWIFLWLNKRLMMMMMMYRWKKKSFLFYFILFFSFVSSSSSFFVQEQKKRGKKKKKGYWKGVMVDFFGEPDFFLLVFESFELNTCCCCSFFLEEGI